ncbi:tRNA (guanosine(37)-N1)-methyltransferase TrmD [Bradymonas sediminis]|uniref:tRNA (guanine-N(1)-)-methyltransferase n=1 Tax=Bradymonas sediminis TaxID=1548548 RepID=A0A2Z4FNW8_9DELT|nr:tRNA (guanosine(37)-N1)-methyltransferase TrmD [Bradymonas sediminis]AWV90354.1 tRNA (guanosine(37)-N1)-methyltransferase TrmD [Bradymonas sediminis]TDP75669.1 tRNA (guanine37-N(1)-) methyltransferase [Bradymonas sediminis]
MKFQLLTIFPEFFESPLSTSILGRAQEKELVEYALVDIREFATDRHRKTDDLPYGGGAGMLMKPEPLVGALEYAREQDPGATRILMSPQGEPLTQALAQELADQPGGLILTCGRYEGVDERVREGWIDREISLGDYVLSGGEPGALVLLDAITRLIPGVLGNFDSIREESFSAPSLEYPQYTRPRDFRGREVPEILLSGDHAKIAQWRRDRALERTRKRRPDLLDPKA